MKRFLLDLLRTHWQQLLMPAIIVPVMLSEGRLVRCFLLGALQRRAAASKTRLDDILVQSFSGPFMITLGAHLDLQFANFLPLVLQVSATGAVDRLGHLAHGRRSPADRGGQAVWAPVVKCGSGDQPHREPGPDRGRRCRYPDSAQCFGRRNHSNPRQAGRGRAGGCSCSSEHPFQPVRRFLCQCSRAGPARPRPFGQRAGEHRYRYDLA